MDFNKQKHSLERATILSMATLTHTTLIIFFSPLSSASGGHYRWSWMLETISKSESVAVDRQFQYTFHLMNFNWISIVRIVGYICSADANSFDLTVCWRKQALELVRKAEFGTRKSASNTSPGTNIAKWHTNELINCFIVLRHKQKRKKKKKK